MNMKNILQNKYKMTQWYFLGGIILSLFTSSLYAQNATFSQFHLAPSQTNPAMIAMSNQTQFILNYRSQFIQDGQAYETPMFSVIYPWLTRNGSKRPAALGLSVLQDKTGENGILTTTGLSFTGALNFNLSPNKEANYKTFLSLGGQVGYFQRRVNQDAITTGSQWDGSSFAGSLPVGEAVEFANATETFATMNFGAMFYLQDDCANNKAFFGVNVQNLNQPANEFFDIASTLPMYYIMHGGINFRLDPAERWTLQPNIRWVREKNTNEYRVGSIAYYNFPQVDGGGKGFLQNGNVGFGAWYDSNSSMAFGVELNKEKYFVGFSYDLGALAPLNTLGSGAVELSLGIKLGKPCKKEGPPKEIILDSTEFTVGYPIGDSVFNYVVTFQGGRLIDEDTSFVRFVAANTPDELLIPSPEDLLIFKRKVYFYYISDDINKGAGAILEDMSETLNKFKGIKLLIQGHTCDIGKDQNKGLSDRRAERVKEFLVSKGVESDRILTKGLADTDPLLSNKTEYGRIKNRRVEFEVIAIGNESE